MKLPVIHGDNILTDDFPEGTVVLTAPPPLPPLKDPRTVVREALENPLSEQPLSEALRECRRIVVAFDDPVLPIPLPAEDPRRIIVGEVLSMAEEAGVGVKLLCANGTHRKWSRRELAAVVGEHAGRAVCHDAEDEENLIELGSVDGMPVTVNREIVESDILVYVNVTFTPMNGGWKSVAVGLGSYESISCHHNPDVFGWNIMDPESSKMHRILWRMGEVIEKNVRVFQVETVVTNELQPSLSLANKKSLRVPLTLKAFSIFPRKMRDVIRSRIRASYRMAYVGAGSVNDVHVETLKSLRRQLELKVDRQFDVVVIGVPNMSPYASFSTQNPVLTANLALGYAYGFLSVGEPILKKNGVLIFCNPMDEVFHEKHHPSYVEFYKTLEETRDPWELREKYERKFAKNERYVKQYRYGYAYHGAHPFFVWYAIRPALERALTVINVAPSNPKVPERMGFEWARSLSEALSKAYSYVGRSASVAYPAMPPVFCTRTG
ncbi:MAG: lactate racemase domain-containing protein [Candidatus Jordarchaeales archaeon]